jgi:nucleoside-diphosphate-sugar epimerase
VVAYVYHLIWQKHNDMIKNRILVTGSSGLIGSALCRAIKAMGWESVELDLRATERNKGDIRDLEKLRDRLSGCHGVVHLAAVSRVAWGQQDPETCRSINIEGTRNLIKAVAAQDTPPWLIFASSREVYGQPEKLPCSEDSPFQPINVYAETKVRGEELIEAASHSGLRVAVIRLANVYGHTDDHADRVIPAFAKAAVEGLALRVDGVAHACDFTHIDDTICAFMGLIEYMQAAIESPPPIHVVTGEPTTLGDLASLAVEIAGTDSSILTAPSRDYDVTSFYGDPTRIHQMLGWKPQISLRQGLALLIAQFREQQCLSQEECA